MAYVDVSESAGAALRRASAEVRRRVAVLVGVVALLLVASLAVPVMTAARQEGDARAINVAGRQRMLSQRIAGAAPLAAEGDAAAATRMATAVEQFVEGHAALARGDGSLGVTRPPFAPLQVHHAGPDGLDQRVAAVEAAAGTVLASPGSPDARRASAALVAAADGPLLAALEEAVTIEESRASGQNQLLRRAVTALGTVALLVLLGVGIGLLRPLLRRMASSADALDRLEAERDRRAAWQRDVAGIASHELRSPVTVVAGTARVLVSHWSSLDDGARLDLAMRLRGSADGMVDLLDELSVVAGLAGPANRSVSWPVSNLGTQLDGMDGVDHDLRAGLWVDLDRDRVTLLLRELVQNALQHGRAPVTVTARPGASPSSLLLCVRDRGDGIAPGRVEQMLAPFGRGTELDSHSSLQGRGLGLSMVRAVVDDAGGALAWVPGDVGGEWRVEVPGAVVDAPVVGGPAAGGGPPPAGADGTATGAGRALTRP